MPESIVVIGIGDDGPPGLSTSARERLAEAEVLVGGQRHLAFFPDWAGDVLTIAGDLDHLMQQLHERAQRQRVAVLASGDPLFYGIGRRLLRTFPRDQLAFIPHLSSVQLAFACIKQSYDDATVVSVHGRALDRLRTPLERRVAKLAILTDPQNTPAAVADYVTAMGLGGSYVLWVCENLGSDTEQVTRWSPAEATRQNFSPLNVTILLRHDEVDHLPGPPLIGIPDNMIEHHGQQRGQITKQEVRLIALARLALRPGDCLWDIGAGSGSLSIEASRLSPELRVLACERSAEACERIRANLRRFGLGGVQLIHGEAPEALAEAPAPDAVFVGGSGGRLDELLPAVLDRLRTGGRLVMTCVTLETQSRAWMLLRGRGLEPTATSLQVAHTQPIGPMHRFEPQTPITILHTTKP